MARSLRRFKDTKNGKVYYLDLRLGEFRNINNPHDVLTIMTKRMMMSLDKDPLPRRDARLLRAEAREQGGN